MSSTRQRSGRVRAQLCVALLLLPGPITPATIVVDDSCSLVDAINAANMDEASGGCPAGRGPDEIRLTRDVSLSLPNNGDNGLPIVTSEITLEGDDHVVARNPDATEFIRVFEVAADGVLTLSNTTVGGGGIIDVDYSLYRDGAGILNRGSVTVVDSAFVDNRGQDGGSIYNQGFLAVSNTTFTDNRAISGMGGAVYTRGYALLTSSTFEQNSSWYAGGAVANAGVLVVESSLFYGNLAPRGGAFYSADFAGADATITNSTFSGNQGGLVEALLTYEGATRVVNTTFSGNGDSPGDYTVYGASLRNSVLGNSAGANCFNILDEGGNLSDDASCAAAETLTGLDPILADNGGPTRTHALLDGSAAIDAAGQCDLDTDQRGFGRTDGACDSGAFEFGASDFFVSVSGTCPGQITVLVVTPQPSLLVTLFTSAGPGTTVLDRGPCAGTELDLDGARLWRRVATGPDGELSITRNFGAQWCGRSVQGIRPGCDVSGLGRFP